MSEIAIDALDPQTMALWQTVCRIAKALEQEQTRWCLVGGLMVALFAIEAEQIQRPTSDIDILFRFEVDGSLVDVLAPDGLGNPAMTDGQFQTIQIPGGTQALERSETVVIVLDGERIPLRRPTLLAAILLKARSLKVHSHPDDQREDLITLLGLMQDLRAAAGALKATERRWLRAAGAKLNVDDDSLLTRFQETHLKVARASYALLTR